MPLLPAELERLDEAYRRSQAITSTSAGLAVLRLWRQIPPEELTLSESVIVEAFLSRATSIIEAGRERSERNAAGFYEVIRRGQTGPGPMPDVKIEAPPEAQIRTSLFVTGVVGVRERLNKIPDPPPIIRPRQVEVGDADDDLPTTTPTLRDRQRSLIDAGRGDAIRDAIERAGVAVAGATIRHTGNAGRDKIRETAKADTRAVGWVRVTRSKPCYYCAMLASRGAVYKEDSFDRSDARFEGPGTAKVHDSCQCSMRPVYTRRHAEWPEFNQAMHELWENGDRDYGVDAITAWRRLYEGRSQD